MSSSQEGNGPGPWPAALPEPATQAARARRSMVEDQLRRRQIVDRRVLAAMDEIPRERFVGAGQSSVAYRDSPLPIGHGQTISQPYMVAAMTEMLELAGTERVLEIGTGSGYQTAILARLAREVVTVERIEPLSRAARQTLTGLGLSNVVFVTGDGTLGHPSLAPYDRILVTAGAPGLPRALTDQLADGGILVIPVGPRLEQTLMRVRRAGAGIRQEDSFGCIFVPLIGEQGWPDEGDRR